MNIDNTAVEATQSMRVLLATSNAHKLAEIRGVFGAASGIKLVSLADARINVPEPVEDQPTFEGNARLKARYYAQASGMACIADDSGLQVDALGGEPGVRSARYADFEGPRQDVDRANNNLLRRNLADVPDERRTARFVCVMVWVDRDGKELSLVRGAVEGRILREPRGENGFGYDPLFFLPQQQRSVAELSAREKNAISHRGGAARLMLTRIQRLRGEPRQ
jgi:XTP/dITP diphosphohydrolase